MVPYDKRSGKIWYNNELVDWADAKIHILNHGLHYASCVFEGERVYEGSIFKLEEHTSRLFYSAKRMGITVPYTEGEINKACNKIIAVQKVEKGLSYAYRDRRNKKRDFRGLWIQRINAAVRKHGISYSVFINKLKNASIDLNRKILSEIAARDTVEFDRIVQSII